MSQTYFSYDPDNGDVDFHTSEQEAIAWAKETLKTYRREANHDGEWAKDVESITVGLLPDGVSQEDANDDHSLLLITHKATAIGDEENGYEYQILPVDPPVEPVIIANNLSADEAPLDGQLKA